jgi:hypothetical protein
MWDNLDGVINEQASVSSLLGMSPAGARLSGYEGDALPASTYSGGDQAAVPWSPDSPLFWGGVLVALTLLGWVGASGSVRLGRARASAEVNT